MKKAYWKVLWFVFSLIPASFLFHFYEYGQYIKQKEASFLFLISVLFVLIVGLLSGLIKARYVILINILSAILSVILALNFIPDDSGWFKPVGLKLAIMLTATVFLIGILLVRIVSKYLLAEK